MTDDLDLMADEYVLGLLDELAERRFEKRLATDSALRDSLARSRERFLALDLTVPEQIGAVTLWPGIEASLTPEVAIAAEPEPPVVAPPEAEAPRRRPLRSYLPAGAAAAAGLVVGAFIASQTLQPDPVVIAVLLSDQGVPQAVVEDFGNENARVRFVADVAVPEGQVMEVWTLPSLEMGPVSLGLLEAAAPRTLDGPELPRPLAGQLYEITIEQEGGSPTGRPTGPILAKGFAALQG